MLFLIIDANILFAAVISSEGATCEILFSPGLMGLSPEFVLEEAEKYIPLLAEKSGCSEEDTRKALSIILSRIKIIPYEEYKDFLQKAEQISPDIGDREYFALALRFNIPIWSNDKQLKEQNVVKILSTKEVLELLRK